jgi:DNA repair exonuclease SbcCD ATPase subunit
MSIVKVRKAIQESRTTKDILTKQINGKRAKLEELRSLLHTQEETQTLIQSVAQETQEQLKIHVQDIVQSALDVCFPNQYKFVMDFVMKNGKTECDILVDKGGELMSPIDSNGGGLVDAISAGLRIACLCLSDRDKVLFMDEPMKFLSAGLKPIMANLLKELSHSLGIQIIMVTHDEEFASIADRTFEVTQTDKKSKVSVK